MSWDDESIAADMVQAEVAEGDPRMRVASIKAYQRIAFQNAKAKGFHDAPREFGTSMALLHSEVSEALEEDRKGMPLLYGIAGNDRIRPVAGEMIVGDAVLTADPPVKPEGVASELADVFIRLMDTSEALGIDLGSVVEAKMRYNATRAHKHGGKSY